MRLKSILLVCIAFLLGGCQSDSYKASTTRNVLDDTAIQINDMKLSVKNKQEMKEVKPEKPSGYYEYYEEHEGYVYYVVQGEVEYQGKNEIKEDAIKIIGKNGKKEYDGKLVFSDVNKSNFIKTLNASEEARHFFIILLIEDDSEAIQSMDIYYNKAFMKQEEKDTFDYQLHWDVS